MVVGINLIFDSDCQGWWLHVSALCGHYIQSRPEQRILKTEEEREREKVRERERESQGTPCYHQDLMMMRMMMMMIVITKIFFLELFHLLVSWGFSLLYSTTLSLILRSIQKMN